MLILQDYVERNSIPEPNSGCWLWLLAGNDRGYGRAHIPNTSRGSENRLYAHRLSYRAFRGNIGNLQVLHRCNNPCCVNPEHLYKGTQKENLQQMSREGRGSKAEHVQKGEKNHLAKLTPEIVLAIRKDPRSQDKIAESYGLGQSHVSRIKLRQTWKHLP